MGGEAHATSTLAYGVKIKGIDWTQLMRNLKRVEVDRAWGVRETTTTNNNNGNDDPTPDNRDPKRAKTTTIFPEWEEKDLNFDKDDNMSELIYFLEDESNGDEVCEASVIAMDKMLGSGHGLMLNVFHPSGNSGSEGIVLLLQVKQDFCCDTFNGGVSSKSVDLAAPGFDKEIADARIRKALDGFGWMDKAETTPGWILIAACRWYE